MRKEQKVVVINDMHCGNRFGLTPPYKQNQLIPTKEVETPADIIQNNIGILQREMWGFFEEGAALHQYPDILVVNGDAIDGRGDRGKNFDTLETNRQIQCEMAYRAIKLFKPKKIYMTKGTPSHVGEGIDFENFILKHEKNFMGIEDKLFLKVNDVMFMFKHHSNNSSTPYGKHTPIAKAALWNELRALHEREPRADIIMLAHTHCYMGIFDTYKKAMTAPALQAEGVQYARKLDGECHFGFLTFNVPAKGKEVWPIPHITNLKTQKPKIYTAA